MRRTLIVGNWKMNGSLSTNYALLENLKMQCSYQAEALGGKRENVEIAVCMPAPYLFQGQLALQNSSIGLGAQDVSMYDSGAYTGEIAASMLRDFGCQFVIVGHSERRSYHNEKSEIVARKALAALAKGISPIVCVGETHTEREAGQTEKIVSEQLDVVLTALSVNQMAHLVVAYEPIWAIGTGKTATPEIAQYVHALIRSLLTRKNVSSAAAIRILYGGSMKPDNARALLTMPDIDGGLIGGSALDAAEFAAIIRAAR